MKGKELKGEKYIYLAMAYKIAKESEENYIQIGNDNGIKGGQNFWRSFSIQEYNGEILLNEVKTSPHFAHFQRTFVIVDTPHYARVYIYEYINEQGENASTCWIH